MSSNYHDSNEELELNNHQLTKEPPLYRVLLHNDDYTTMEFVVHILETIFHKTLSEATAIMLQVHHRGIGVCGHYPREIAETKVTTVTNLAQKRGFPLRCSMEKS